MSILAAIDSQWKNLMEKGAFSEKAVITVGETEYSLYGIFFSGNYGQKDFDKGYSVRKPEKRQSFRIALSSLPEGVTVKDLVRKSLSVRGSTWTVREVTGNESGTLNLELVPSATQNGGNNAGIGT